MLMRSLSSSKVSIMMAKIVHTIYRSSSRQGKTITSYTSILFATCLCRSDRMVELRPKRCTSICSNQTRPWNRLPRQIRPAKLKTKTQWKTTVLTRSMSHLSSTWAAEVPCVNSHLKKDSVPTRKSNNRRRNKMRSSSTLASNGLSY